MKNGNFYNRKLCQYFDAHLQRYTETAEWHENPAPNQWRFEIPDLRIVVTLTCDENGHVREERTSMK